MHKASRYITFHTRQLYHLQMILELLLDTNQHVDMKWIHLQSQQKAMDLARWLNFTKRKRKERFAVVNGPEDDFVVMPQADVFENELSLVELKGDYSDLSFKRIELIRTDEDPLKFWENLTGAFTAMDTELLHYILKMKIPLKKLIRYELAIRGFDQNNNWVGFEASKDIWLK